MTSFAAGPRAAIESFAASMGVPANPARDGSYSFVFARSGALSLTPAEGRTLISLTIADAGRERSALKRALSSAGYDPTTNRFLHVGLTRDDSVVFSIAVEDVEMDVPTIEGCLQRLMAARGSL